MKLLVLLTSTMISGIAAASPQTLWSCEGANTEGVTVTKAGERTVINLSWDCFPGGGICSAKSTVQAQPASPGSYTYAGPAIQLQFQTTTPLPGGRYRAHLQAIDNVDTQDMGRGLRLDEAVICKQGSVVN